MRIMAVDYGDAHTGVAISDPTGMLAGWTTTIDSRKQDVVVEQLKEIIAQRGVDEIVLGYPKNMNDTKGERVLKSEALAARLEEETGLPIHLWDERLTTVDAHRILSENGRRGKKRKQRVDAVAATLILEGYLGFRRNQNQREGGRNGAL
ncbi:MAG: Holliday junction resolvase RuvX [Candidatus Onthomonas sp.]|nr:Holliday junction resolvase RuvX [Candidatus Onthomonas sp.]